MLPKSSLLSLAISSVVFTSACQDKSHNKSQPPVAAQPAGGNALTDKDKDPNGTGTVDPDNTPSVGTPVVADGGPAVVADASSSPLPASDPSATPSPVLTPVPLPEPAPETSPTPSPMPIPAPAVIPLPVPSPISAPEPVPVPVPTPVPAPIPLPDPTPVPAPIPLPDPTPTPIPLPVPAPTPEPIPTPMPVPVPTPEPVPSIGGLKVKDKQFWVHTKVDNKLTFNTPWDDEVGDGIEHDESLVPAYAADCMKKAQAAFELVGESPAFKAKMDPLLQLGATSDLTFVVVVVESSADRSELRRLDRDAYFWHWNDPTKKPNLGMNLYNKGTWVWEVIATPTQCIQPDTKELLRYLDYAAKRVTEKGTQL